MYYATEESPAPINSCLNVMVWSPPPFGLGRNGCWPSRGSPLSQEFPLHKPLFFSFLALALYSPPCPLLHLSFYLNLSGRSGRKCLLSLPGLSGYNGSTDTRFSRVTTRLISWPDRERYLCPLQSLVVSLLLCIVPTLLFFRTGGVLSHLNSLTHRLPRFPPRNLSPLSRSVCSLSSFAATDTAYC